VNWGANNDGDGVIRVEPDGGAVLAEMRGPGCIWRIWAGTPVDGHVKIFLDGSKTPAVDWHLKTTSIAPNRRLRVLLWPMRCAKV